MWLHLSLSLVTLFASSVFSSEIKRPLDCEDPLASVGEACARPIDDIVAVAPGSSYIAKIECKDCPWVNGGRHHKVVNRDQIFVCVAQAGGFSTAVRSKYLSILTADSF
jgi:hypothetical protein